MKTDRHGNSRRVLVAHNVERHGWGGMARLSESLHTALEEFGWNTEYFTSDDVEHIKSTRVRRHSFAWYARRHVRKAFLRGEPYDIVNIHESAGAATVLGKSRLGSPAVVAMVYGVELRYWEMRKRTDAYTPDFPTLRERVSVPLLTLWQSKLTVRRADYVLCSNQQDRAFLQSRLHVDGTKITPIVPGAGPEFSSVASRRAYARPCTKVLFPGTWLARKGIVQVVDAFSVLASKHPSLQLGVLGAGCPEARVLRDFPEGIRSRIKIFPPLPHQGCAEVFLDYDIFLLPSFFEGTPLSLIEGMYTGIPVITTNTAGMKDVIEDGQNGLLVTPGSAGEIVRAVETLMADASLRERLGRRGLADATSKYTWRAAAEIVNGVYSGLLKGNDRK